MKHDYIPAFSIDKGTDIQVIGRRNPNTNEIEWLYKVEGGERKTNDELIYRVTERVLAEHYPEETKQGDVIEFVDTGEIQFIVNKIFQKMFKE